MIDLDKLAEVAYYKFQGIEPPCPGDRLSWEECKELADPSHPEYSTVYEHLYNDAINVAASQLN